MGVAEVDDHPCGFVLIIEIRVGFLHQFDQLVEVLFEDLRSIMYPLQG